MTMPTHTNVAFVFFPQVGIPSSGGSYGEPRPHTLINISYDVRGARKADLGQLATRHLGIGVGSRSLEDLCAGVLGHSDSRKAVFE